MRSNLMVIASDLLVRKSRPDLRFVAGEGVEPNRDFAHLGFCEFGLRFRVAHVFRRVVDSALLDEPAQRFRQRAEAGFGKIAHATLAKVPKYRIAALA